MFWDEHTAAAAYQAHSDFDSHSFGHAENLDGSVVCSPSRGVSEAVPSMCERVII